MFPPVRPAWEQLGAIRPEVATATGLSRRAPSCAASMISSASYLAYLKAGIDRATILSTGTWIIGFNPLQHLDRLDPERDTVANSTVFGVPLASSRYMGGAEYAYLVDGGPRVAAGADAAAAMIAGDVMALPSFVGWGGPYMGCRGTIQGKAPAGSVGRTALASLYIALVSNTCLDLLGSHEDLIVEGHVAQNEVYMRALATLRPGQRLFVSSSPVGSALGASLLWNWAGSKPSLKLDPVALPPLPGFAAYAARWRRQAERAFQERGRTDAPLAAAV